jgi:hypothetical protein
MVNKKKERKDYSSYCLSDNKEARTCIELHSTKSKTHGAASMAHSLKAGSSYQESGPTGRKRKSQFLQLGTVSAKATGQWWAPARAPEWEPKSVEESANARVRGSERCWVPATAFPKVQAKGSCSASSSGCG